MGMGPSSCFLPIRNHSPFAMNQFATMEATGALHVHVGADDSSHRISADLLSTLAKTFQELALLAAAAERGRGTGERIRYTGAFCNEFVVEFATPEPGSFFLPFSLVNKLTPLCPDTKAVLCSLMAMLAALSAREQTIPGTERLSPSYKARFAQLVSRFVSPEENDWSVSIEANGMDEAKFRSVTFSREMSDHAKALFENPPPPKEETMSVIGDLVSIDFEKHELTIRHQQTKKEINCDFRPEIIDKIVSERESGVQVTGRFTLDADGFPKRLTDVTSVVPVDLSPISISTFSVDSTAIGTVDGQPIVISPKLDEDSHQVFVVEDESLGLDVFASTRDELVSEIQAQLSVLWREYALENDSKLTDSAIALKNRLLAKFKEVVHA